MKSNSRGPVGLPRTGWYLSLLAMYLAFVSAAANAQQQSRRVTFADPPRWSFSGALAPGGAWLLVDSLQSQIRRYEIQGKKAVFVGTVEGPQQGPLAFPTPTGLTALDDGNFLLEDGEGHFVWLDRDLKPTRSLDLLERGRGPQGNIRSVFAWAAMGSSLLTLSDVEHQGTWSNGLLEVPIAAPDRFNLLEELSLDDPARSLYLLTAHPLASSPDGKAFALQLTERPRILEFTSGSGKARPLEPISGNLGSRPVVPKMSGSADLPRAYAALAQSEATQALYSWNGSLYALARRPEGRWKWSLTRINPETGASIYAVSIPSVAPHLFVIPGETFAFVEKGEVKSLGHQEVRSILLVPAERIENPRRR